MSAYLKSLELHVYLATTKKFYLDNDKHIEANTAIKALRHTLSKNYLSLISHCNSRFCSVEHIDLSQGTSATHFGERI